MTMKNIIMERLGCPEKRAEAIAADLENLSEPLKPLLETWLRTGEADDGAMYEGCSLNSLMKDHGMRFTGAVLTLDWLIKDPKAAKAAMARGIR